MSKYYVHNGNEQIGPFDISELKNRNISKLTEVWYEGLSDWTKAGEINELNELFKQNVPPPIKPKVNPQPIPNQPKNSNLIQNIIRLILIIIGVIVALYIIGAIIDSNDNPSPATYIEQKMTIEETENSNPTMFLKADGKYNSSFWGTELKISGTITNEATVSDYKDVTVRVTYYSKTKSVLGSQDYTIYEVFQPNTATPFRLDIKNYKDVATIGWEVIGAVPNQ